MDADNTGAGPRLRDVLLVEDDPGDAALVQDVFDSQHAQTHVHLATDGLDAVDFLRRRGQHTDAARPDLILLDLNMPRMDGREFLAAIKPDRLLGGIPIVVFTTSGNGEDIARSYAAGANAYVTKPLDLDDFCSVINSIHDFYSRTAMLPPRSATDLKK